VEHLLHAQYISCSQSGTMIYNLAVKNANLNACPTSCMNKMNMWFYTLKSTKVPVICWNVNKGKAQKRIECWK